MPATKGTIRYHDGETEDFETVSVPWTYKTFLVLDTGNDEFRYIPLANVSDFTVPKV